MTLPPVWQKITAFALCYLFSFLLFSIFFSSFLWSPSGVIILGILLIVQVLSIIFLTLFDRSSWLCFLPLAVSGMGDLWGESPFFFLMVLGIPLTVMSLSFRSLYRQEISLAIGRQTRRPLGLFFLISSFFFCLLYGEVIFQKALPFFQQQAEKQVEVLRQSMEADIRSYYAPGLELCKGNALCEEEAEKKIQQTLQENEAFLGPPTGDQLKTLLQESPLMMSLQEMGLSFSSIMGLFFFGMLIIITPFWSLLVSFIIVLVFFGLRMAGVFSIEYRHVYKAYIL